MFVIFITFAVPIYYVTMRITDTRGQLCPAPIIAAKRTLREASTGETFLILTDNMTSFNNLSRFLKDNNTSFSSEEKDGTWTFTVKKLTGTVNQAKAEEYCEPDIPHFQKGDYVVVISSDRMGDGDSELGQLLIGNFIKALKDLDKLPDKILFYNKGVTLVTKTSPHINNLRDLEKMGVELMLCGTCVDHYKLREETGAGTISNMFTLADVMASAGKIIKP